MRWIKLFLENSQVAYIYILEYINQKIRCLLTGCSSLSMLLEIGAAAFLNEVYPRACVCRHAHAYACSKTAYASFINAYTYTRTHARVPETMKDKFSALKLRFGINPTSFESHSKSPFSQYKKPYMVYFQKTQKILRENLKFTRSSESKREFFTKHPQVNFLLIRTFFGLDLQVLKFINQFCLIMKRYD